MVTIVVLSRLVYSFLLILAAPVVWAWLLWRHRQSGAQWDIITAERFGRYPQPWDEQAPVWVHAVSVGEVRAAAPLIHALLLQGETVLLTHLTPTGRAEGQRLLAEEIRQGRVRQQWVPYDFAGSVSRFVRHFRPRMAILIEREVWPNLVATVSAAGIPLILASARLSERSFKQALWVNRLFAGLLYDTYAKIDLALAQTEADAARLFDAGLPRVVVTGNLKFDVHPPVVAVQAGRDWRAKLARPVVVIASTREGEDLHLVPLIKAQVQAAATDTAAKPLYILIPRHPQRFDEAARLLDASGCRYARWSILRNDPLASTALPRLDVVLGDTMGEMPFFYGAADVAVVAGSFEAHGGQNFIEASASGVPVIVGPHTRNFADAVVSAKAAGALVQVNSAQAAFAQVADWLAEPETAKAVGEAGRAWVGQHVGATGRVMEAINELVAVPSTHSARRGSLVS